MSENFDSEKIEQLLIELIDQVAIEWGGQNPFGRLDAALEIVQNRDIDNYESILVKFRELAYPLADNLNVSSEVFKLMDEITELINEGKD